MTSHGLSKLCFECLMEEGVSACTACEHKVVVPALDNVVEANTLLSGLGFESGGLAAAHAIHNGFTTLDETHQYYHGEKVTIGLLAQLWMTGRERAMIDRVYKFCRSVGLPTTLAQTGLANATDRQIEQVAERACVPGETIHNTPFAVTLGWWSPRSRLRMLRADACRTWSDLSIGVAARSVGRCLSWRHPNFPERYFDGRLHPIFIKDDSVSS
jgi:glycerol dehydrogenase-like iron-containing ADH family enzyme